MNVEPLNGFLDYSQSLKIIFSLIDLPFWQSVNLENNKLSGLHCYLNAQRPLNNLYKPERGYPAISLNAMVVAEYKWTEEP
jgi:hypothetical protein